MKAQAPLRSRARGRASTALLTFSLVCANCLGACRPQPAPAAVRYPALANAPPTSPVARSVFEPAATLTALTLACRAHELPEANALDDDCNQRIDDGLTGPGAPAASEAEGDAVLLALAYPQTAALKLGLRSDASLDTVIDLTPTDCGSERAFCTVRFAVRQLAPGRHTLIANSAALAAGTQPPSVVVSVQSRGRVTTYLAPVPPGVQEQPLGQLALP